VGDLPVSRFGAIHPVEPAGFRIIHHFCRDGRLEPQEQLGHALAGRVGVGSRQIVRGVDLEARRDVIERVERWIHDQFRNRRKRGIGL